MVFAVLPPVKTLAKFQAKGKAPLREPLRPVLSRRVARRGLGRSSPQLLAPLGRTPRGRANIV